MSYEPIRNTVKACMFDQYGTVFDMQGGLTAIATPFLKKKGLEGRSQFLRHVVATDAF